MISNRLSVTTSETGSHGEKPAPEHSTTLTNKAADGRSTVGTNPPDSHAGEEPNHDVDDLVVGFDVFRFEEGFAVERWDNLQPKVAAQPEGRRFKSCPRH